MATICCSPPDSVPASWPARSNRIGKQRVDTIERMVPGVATSLGIGAHLQVFAHRQRLEHLPSFRDVSDTKMGALRRRQFEQVLPQEGDLTADAGGTMPEMVLNRVDLPAPFGPTTVTNWPALTDSETSVRARRPP